MPGKHYRTYNSAAIRNATKNGKPALNVKHLAFEVRNNSSLEQIFAELIEDNYSRVAIVAGLRQGINLYYNNCAIAQASGKDGNLMECMMIGAQIAKSGTPEERESYEEAAEHGPDQLQSFLATKYRERNPGKNGLTLEDAKQIQIAGRELAKRFREGG